MTVLTKEWFLFGGGAVLFTVLGGLIPLLKNWKEDHLHSFVSFSAGILMATALLHLLPDAIRLGQPKVTGFGILFSFLFLFILEKFVMIHPCEESHCDYHTMGWAAFGGMTLHTFMDGMVLGSSLMVEGLAFVVFAAIMAHKIPSSFALASILKKAKWSTKKILLFLFLFGLTIPAGALASFFFIKAVGANAIGISLALSLGTFLYISTSDFLPEVHRSLEHRFQNLASFLLGILVMTVLALIPMAEH